VTIRLHRGHVFFRCRVGHVYSLTELVCGKEQVIEKRLWMVVYAFEELAALLRDCDRHGLAEGFDMEAWRRRASFAREQAARVRAIIDADRPLFVSSGEEQSADAQGISA